MSEALKLSYTPRDAIPAIAETANSSFLSGKTKPLDFRLVQLRKLYWGLKDNAALLGQACLKDLGKGSFETTLTEIDFCTFNIVFSLNHLAKWTADEKVPDQAITNYFMYPSIRKDPMGCVLIIGPFNFPIQLLICPLIGAIAAGCTAVLKPSENAPATAAAIQTILESCLDQSCYKVVQGEVAETSALMNQKWDKIFYTGGARVGTIIAKKAAETLTPVTLELGGRNPAIVTANANCYLAARRTLWGKTMNAGQVCLSSNYVLVDRSVLDQFTTELKTALKEFYPSGPRNSPDFGRIVNKQSWQRLKDLLDSTKGTILAGGEFDASDLYIAPTVILLSSATDPLLETESFGPFIPVLPYDSLPSAISIANATHATPLALSAFGTPTETSQILSQVRSGGASINDSYLHGSLPTLPFGGVGDSGTGSYRGRASYDCFTHHRTVTITPGWMEAMLKIRYPPFTEAKLAKMRKLTVLKPNVGFDREGKVVAGGWFAWLVRLGAGGTAGGVFRYLLLILVRAKADTIPNSGHRHKAIYSMIVLKEAAINLGEDKQVADILRDGERRPYIIFIYIANDILSDFH